PDLALLAAPADPCFIAGHAQRLVADLARDVSLSEVPFQIDAQVASEVDRLRGQQESAAAAKPGHQGGRLALGLLREEQPAHCSLRRPARAKDRVTKLLQEQVGGTEAVVGGIVTGALLKRGWFTSE